MAENELNDENELAAISKPLRKLWPYDIAAAFAFGLIFAIPIFQSYEIHKGVIAANGRLPAIYEKIFYLDMLPSAFGFFWLVYRYAFYLAPRFRFMRTQRFRNFIIFGVPCAILFLIWLIGRLWN
jgi:hypothetical protein